VNDDDLERAIGDWLLRKESDPALLPGEFAKELPASLRTHFLAELEELAAIDGMATMAPPRDLPRRYGDFRVFGELGRGAMGCVFDAEQVSTGRRVALKVMHGHVARDGQSHSRFRREAQTAASLEHPGIVPVFGFGETDGCAWLAMDRIEGRSLQRLLAAANDARDVDHVRARGFLDDRSRLASSLADAADALAFAHRHGVVHRDVKPANLMCRDDGRLVVLDFGLATARDADAATLTRTGEFLGTPLYMAPEQAVGAENGTAASDVFALGAVLYECLCGRPPVPPGPLATVIDAILNRDPVDPRRIGSAVPAPLARIAMQCLEKDPRDRYASADALAADLRRFAADEEIHAKRSGSLRRSLRRWRRRPRAAAWPAVVVLLVSALVVVFAASWRRAGENLRLRREQDLTKIDELLASAPERLTVFGGASRRFYARLGLGDELGDDMAARSPAAGEALALAEALVGRHPDDVEVLRTLAMTRLDVGDDEASTATAIERLLACPRATAADRMLAAVWHRQRGRVDEARRLRASAPVDDAGVAWWLGFWFQDEQDHAAAIDAFSTALRSPDLGSERRYWALLHRGWCKTCPDVADLGGAADDLLQAAALRPRYGTARLLLAALRCLQARKAEDLAAPVAMVKEVLQAAEPWVHMLTARVLLALAEGGVLQDGPIAFEADYSPIAVLPVPTAFANAFADLGLGLLDEVIRRDPTAFEARLHRITALALLGRSADALVDARALAANGSPARRAAAEVQAARVHLAAGSAARALDAVQRALALTPDDVAARRVEAIAAAHLGDVRRQLAALDAVARRLLALPRETSVFPDAAAMLPETQLARARAMHALGRVEDAVALLREGDFGGPLAGADSARVVLQRSALLAAWGRKDDRVAVAAIANSRSPLRWLAHPEEAAEPSDASARMASWRGWLPVSALARSPADPSLHALLQRSGVMVPPSTAPAGILLRNAASLLTTNEGVASLAAAADRAIAADPRHGDARLLRALVAYVRGEHRSAADLLSASIGEDERDLRARYLLAVVADALGERDLVRRALQRGDGLLTAAEIDAAAAHVPLADRPSATSLLAGPQ